MQSSIGNVNIYIDEDLIERKRKAAQTKLNLAVQGDSEQYVPFDKGGLRGSVIYPEGLSEGVIEYNTPYAHYMYEGELYLDKNGSSWAAKGDKKYPTGKPLNYHEPNTGARWFEQAKAVNKERWINVAREAVKNA